MSLSNFITSRYNNKPVTVKALVTGKADTTYTIPTCIRIQRGEILISHDSLLEFIDKSNQAINKNIKNRILFCPFREFGDKNNFRLKKFISLLRIFILDPQVKDGKTFTCYFIGTDIEVNQIYEFSGTVVVDPKNQNATAIFASAKKIPSQIESFSITKETHNRLNEFCVPANFGAEKILSNHLMKLYESYAANVTHIYDRWDLHLAIDLVFHSPMSFNFDGEYFHKGWADVAVIGDTRVGKGFVAEGFQRYFGVGEVISSDNASLTGLIGGMKQIEKNWTVKWGKFPKNDGGLLILDETSKLSRNIISRLTRIRSEGIAEIIRVQSYSAPARVRTIFLLNPGNGKNISQFPYGILSILSVFKDPATVSRFDYVLVVSIDEANIKVVHKKRDTIPEIFAQELEQQLIYWIWSRKANDIVFSESAIERVYMLALDLADKYSFDVPLIQGENIRYKLAKIAICFAGRLYSNKLSGKQLFVDACHVECGWVFLNMIYKKRASSYYAMSQIKKSFSTQNDQQDLSAIENYFKSFYNKRSQVLNTLLMNSSIAITEISEQAGIGKDVAIEMIGKLIKYRMIQRQGFSYVKSDRFVEWLRDSISESIGG